MFVAAEREQARPSKSPSFPTTHWSVVLNAVATPSSDSNDALEILCQSYWFPLYAYIRRQGNSTQEAEDLTQAFFSRVLEKNYLQAVDREKGRFRSFLLAALNHFLANERDRVRTLKRGGKQTFVSFENEEAEELYREHSADSLTPAMIFERRWALAVLDQALRRLRDEFINTGRASQFERLKSFLEGEVRRGDYRAVAEELDATPGAVAMAVQRMRQRYRELVRSVVAETVADPTEVELEMRHLFTALTQTS